MWRWGQPGLQTELCPQQLSVPCCPYRAGMCSPASASQSAGLQPCAPHPAFSASACTKRDFLQHNSVKFYCGTLFGVKLWVVTIGTVRSLRSPCGKSGGRDPQSSCRTFPLSRDLCGPVLGFLVGPPPDPRLPCLLLAVPPYSCGALRVRCALCL